jgi:uncharacterized membrane protein
VFSGRCESLCGALSTEEKDSALRAPLLSLALAFASPLADISSDLDTFEPTVFDAVAIFAPAVFLLAAIIAVFGPDPKTTYDREYEQAPPTDTPPAFVPPLLRRAVQPETDELTATLFDLVRRGYFHADPLTDERGNADLVLRRGNRDVPLERFETPVAAAFDDALAEGPLRLSRLGARLEEDPENVLRFENFRQAVKSAIERRGWYTFTAARVLLFTSLALLVVGMAGTWLLYSVSTRATFYFGATMIDGTGLLFHASWIAKLVRRRRRTEEGQLEARRWQAFRRYLTDFPNLRDAPAMSLELWERYLVYAIAFGLAHRVLDGTRLYRLEGLAGSPIFWLGLETAPQDGRADVYTRLAPASTRSRAGRLLVGARR